MQSLNQKPVNCSHCQGNKEVHISLCNKHFKALHRLWTKKLEISGFQDIEQPEFFKSGIVDGHLKQWASSSIFTSNRTDAEWIESKQEYYRVAGHFLHEHVFASEAEKSIWELHSEGKGVDTIVSLLNSVGIKYYLGKRVNQKNVAETLKCLKKQMIDELLNEQKRSDND